MLRKNTLEIARMKPEIIEDINLGHRALGHNFLEISVFFLSFGQGVVTSDWSMILQLLQTKFGSKKVFVNGLTQGNFTIYTIYNPWFLGLTLFLVQKCCTVVVVVVAANLALVI